VHETVRYAIQQVEEVRLALLSSEGAVGHLAALLGHAEEWVRTGAAAALGNLAACRSDFQDAQPQVRAAVA
jgi:Armadillo/beta-catenin-like repeat